MTIRKIAEILDAKIIVGREHQDREIHCAGATDMHSVTLSSGCHDMLLLTGQLTEQTIRTCLLSDITSVVVVRGLETSPEVKALARQKQMVLMGTAQTLYSSCGKLFSAGLPGVAF